MVLLVATRKCIDGLPLFLLLSKEAFHYVLIFRVLSEPMSKSAQPDCERLKSFPVKLPNDARAHACVCAGAPGTGQEAGPAPPAACGMPAPDPEGGLPPPGIAQDVSMASMGGAGDMDARRLFGSARQHEAGQRFEPGVQFVDRGFEPFFSGLTDNCAIFTTAERVESFLIFTLGSYFLCNYRYFSLIANNFL